MEKYEKDFLLNEGKSITGWYVYGWVNADWGGVYFYIGKGHDRRYRDFKKRGMAFRAIYDNWECFPVILRDGMTEEEACKFEVEMKQEMIFKLGYPIMDGEGHSDSLKHLAADYAKKEKRKNDPNYHEGRKALEIPDNFGDYQNEVSEGRMSVVAACAEMGISRSTWYKWNRMEESCRA